MSLKKNRMRLLNLQMILKNKNRKKSWQILCLELEKVVWFQWLIFSNFAKDYSNSETCYFQSVKTLKWSENSQTSINTHPCFTFSILILNSKIVCIKQFKVSCSILQSKNGKVNWNAKILINQDEFNIWIARNHMNRSLNKFQLLFDTCILFYSITLN